MTVNHPYEDVVFGIASNLVDDIDSLDIKILGTEKNLIVAISCADTDRGKLIGSKGMIINAIKLLITAMGSKRNQNVLLTLEG